LLQWLTLQGNPQGQETGSIGMYGKGRTDREAFLEEWEKGRLFHLRQEKEYKQGQKKRKGPVV